MGWTKGASTHLPRRLPAIRREAKKEHRWRLPVTMTHKDVARVMLATRDVLEGMALNSEGGTCGGCATRAQTRT